MLKSPPPIRPPIRQWSPAQTAVAFTPFPFCSPAPITSRQPDGFQSASHTNILLHVADNLSIDFALQVGSTSTAVTVEATTPLINTSSSWLGQIIDNQRIVDLPLDGRDPISLAGLSTGVVPVPPNANIHQGDNTPSINGAANFTSEVMIDGVPDTAPRNGALDNFLIYTPTVDTVAEFRSKPTLLVRSSDDSMAASSTWS